MKTKLAIAVCEFGDTFAESITNIKAAGFDTVMLYEKHGDLEGNIRTTLDAGLQIFCVHLEQKKMNDLWAAGAENKELVKTIKYNIKTCGKYGIGVVVMHSTHRAERNEITVAGPNEFALSCMRDILKTAEKYKVRIALENVAQIQNHLYYLLDNIDSPWLGFCYDCGHHYLYTPKVDFATVYGNRLFAVHIHDNFMNWSRRGDSSVDIHILPGDGNIDFEKVISDIERTSYDGPVLLELHNKASKSYAEQISIYQKLYDTITDAEFLAEAHKRGEELIKLLGER